MNQQNNLNPKKNIFSDRIVIMLAVITVMYMVLLLKFYKLQIVDHQTYEQDLRSSVERTVEVPAVRGIIYDRYGKPLATNQPIYVLKIDPQVIMSKDTLNEVLLSVANLLEENGDTYTDNIPISKTIPFEFTENKTKVRSFITNYLPYDDQEHKEVLYTYSAEQLMDYIRNDVFAISQEITDIEARKIVAMRLEMYLTAYQKYKKIVIAEDISQETLAAIEENREKYPSVSAEVDSRRMYTYGKAFGNVLGYTRKITASQYENMKEDGYDQDDIIGQGGIESSMESELRGQKGKKIIEVDNVGREVYTLSETDNKEGNDVYLSIDANLQIAAYEALEKRLSEAIVQRLKGGLKGLESLTGREVLVSMIDNNQLDLDVMAEAPESEMQRQLYDKVYASYEATLKEKAKEEIDLPEGDRTELSFKQHFSDMINAEDSPITEREMLLALSEQGALNLDEDVINRLRQGSYVSTESIIINQLESGTLKPDQMSIAPFSGSVVVVDVNTGETLAVVGYPSYDSNDMTQNFNRYYTLYNDGIDSREMLWNRATRTTKAPGSTFKMITGIAGIEEGVVDANTVIYDTGVYTRAGSPFPKCWIYSNSGGGHGNVDVERALEVSCNFYFYDVAYRLGLKYGSPYGGIDALSKYVEMFGLSEKTGIEIEEEQPNISNPANIVRTNTSQVFNNIKNMGEETKKNLFTNINSYLEDGFYTYGSSKSTDVDGRIDYLTQYELKRSLDVEIAKVLAPEIGTINEKFLEDIQLDLNAHASTYVTDVVEAVLSDTRDLSLKAKTKEQVSSKMLEALEDGTRRYILKVVKKISPELINNAYRSAYNNAYDRYMGTDEDEAVLSELQNRIAAIDKGTFDGYNLLTNKIEDRLISCYLDYYFASREMEWTTAITIRTAIGQGNNAFSPVQIARYIAGLANGKEVYDLKLVGGIYDHKGEDVYTETENVVYNTLDIKESTLETIYQGMRRVINGSEGSARKYFSDFPIEVAGKTGTAEQGSHEHSWFVGFAPYNNPEIAIVTSMYDANGLGSYNLTLARDILDIYFGVNNEIESVTLDNEVIE